MNIIRDIRDKYELCVEDVSEGPAGSGTPLANEVGMTGVLLGKSLLV